MKLFVGAVVSCLALPAIFAVQPVGTPDGASAAPVDALTLVHQDLALAKDAPLIVTFRPPTPLAPDSKIVVTASQKIDKRSELSDAIRHKRGSRFADSVDLDPVADPASVVTGADRNVTITVPTESATRTAAALQFATAGLYPVVINVLNRNNVVVGELITFVDRLPGDGDASLGSINVAVVASLTATPVIPGTTTPLPTDVKNAITDLINFSPDVPLSIAISPEILDQLEPATLESLRTVLARNVVISQPRIPMDPSLAAGSGQQELFTRLLVDGENAMTARAEVRSTERSAWLATTSLTTAGAAMLRDLGARIAVISDISYRAADGQIGGPLDIGIDQGYSDYSQLLRILLPGKTTLPAAVIDPRLEDRLVETAITGEQAAIFLAAELVVWRDQSAATISPVAGHSVVLGLSKGGVPNPGLVARATKMAGPAGAGAIVLTDMSRFERATDYQIPDGSPLDITLRSPDSTESADLAARATNLDALNEVQVTVSSMLVDDKGRTDRWQKTIETLRSSAITDTQVTQTMALLDAEFTTIKSCVATGSSYAFTLSGFRTNLPVRIENTCAEPLDVVIRIGAGADKLRFPGGDQPVTLEPNRVNNFTVPVVARTNGSFTVTLNVLTPVGETPIVHETTLKGRVNTLTGLAQVLTGGGLLVLLTWWVRNLRRSRRARRNTGAMGHHPATTSATLSDS